MKVFLHNIFNNFVHGIVLRCGIFYFCHHVGTKNSFVFWGISDFRRGMLTANFNETDRNYTMMLLSFKFG
jgi:hypothetical protein